MSAVRKITEHVYWLPPAPPDRPSICAVVGDRRTVMLDAGSSGSHTSAFLTELVAEGVRRPSAVVYTHSHWDHVLGGAELSALVIAHTQTAAGLIALAERDWSDDGLDERVVAGLSSPRHAADVKAELPSPRVVDVAPADIVFHDRIEVDVGRAVLDVRHVGGDHCPDACVICVQPDGMLFLGDCLSASPDGVLTARSAFRLRDVILGFDAEHFVEGHHDAVSSRTEMEALFEKIELAERAAREGRTLEPADADTEYFLEAFRAGQTDPREGMRRGD